MPIDHSAPPPETAEVQAEGPLGDYFNQFIERVTSGAGDAPSEQLKAGMRAFFFCGANAAMSILFSRAMSPADRKIIVEAMSREITGKEFFQAASKSMVTIQ